jgi:hypothetical protein
VIGATIIATKSLGLAASVGVYARWANSNNGTSFTKWDGSTGESTCYAVTKLEVVLADGILVKRLVAVVAAERNSTDIHGVDRKEQFAHRNGTEHLSSRRSRGRGGGVGTFFGRGRLLFLLTSLLFLLLLLLCVLSGLRSIGGFVGWGRVSSLNIGTLLGLGSQVLVDFLLDALDALVRDGQGSAGYARQVSSRLGLKPLLHLDETRVKALCARMRTTTVLLFNLVVRIDRSGGLVLGLGKNDLIASIIIIRCGSLLGHFLLGLRNWAKQITGIVAIGSGVILNGIEDLGESSCVLTNELDGLIGVLPDSLDVAIRLGNLELTGISLHLLVTTSELNVQSQVTTIGLELDGSGDLGQGTMRYFKLLGDLLEGVVALLVLLGNLVREARLRVQSRQLDLNSIGTVMSNDCSDRTKAWVANVQGLGANWEQLVNRESSLVFHKTGINNTGGVVEQGTLERNRVGLDKSCVSLHNTPVLESMQTLNVLDLQENLNVTDISCLGVGVGTSENISILLPKGLLVAVEPVSEFAALVPVSANISDANDEGLAMVGPHIDVLLEILRSDSLHRGKSSSRVNLTFLGLLLVLLVIALLEQLLGSSSKRLLL